MLGATYAKCLTPQMLCFSFPQMSWIVTVDNWVGCSHFFSFPTHFFFLIFVETKKKSRSLGAIYKVMKVKSEFIEKERTKFFVSRVNV